MRRRRQPQEEMDESKDNNDDNRGSLGYGSLPSARFALPR